MDPIEKAIRSAFEKGDAEDKAFRENVYRKAFAALDRALQANPNLTVEAAINRRKVLQAKIAEIETEFIPAAPAVEPEPADPLAGAFEMRMEPGAAPPIFIPEVSVEPVGPDLAPSGDGTLGDIDVRGEKAVEPLLASAERGPAVAPDPDAWRARRGRKPLAVFFIVASLAALIGMGFLFAFQTGLFKSPAERDTSVPNPPSTAEGEDFIPENEEPPVLSSRPEENRDWIGIFTPADATSVSAPGGTTAEAMQDESGSFIRIRSGEPGSAVVFDVGQGVLERIAGRKATFDIVARAAEGQETEMAVDCNFGELGDCGRKRYAVGYEKADFLFELGPPAESPGAGGTIAIVPDFAEQGRAVDIYEIKVSVAP
ncbi:hypothetical protein RB623_25365 [Mesorhizobium sp. LHD-90]|uniref:hypothetical protein n=1 Tax=Mesorhizobium sp. LHD-90 TaxID=3071414 RepID=UPI0027E05C42|nr:hypothetical protein [Mesorhizobium sp. LHD-90]MDQ6437396.1 hypothetical protein [Mesorhizobium sp. LHD-90]